MVFPPFDDGRVVLIHGRRPILHKSHAARQRSCLYDFFGLVRIQHVLRLGRWQSDRLLLLGLPGDGRLVVQDDQPLGKFADLDRRAPVC